MTNQQPKRQHGGARAGAGRPTNTPQLLPDMPKTDSPLEWLLALMGNADADVRLRVTAATAALPYMHARKGEAGVKSEAESAAKQASRGKYAASRAPVRLVT